MWILECDGNILQGKRIWLRPGKRYLFGRTSNQGEGKLQGIKIDHGSISRKHLTIAVAAIKPGDGVSLGVRSQVTLTDEKSKHGTHVDGEKVSATQKELTGTEHTFTLGSYEHAFHVKWHPVVLTFTFSSKDTKGGKDPLIPIRSRLEDLDIKTIAHYVPGKTTHVVAGKRNTAKSLQALIHGIYLVDHRFLNALEYATAPENLNEPESLSPLEADFESAWPNALEYLPGPGKEPNERPTELFAPDSGRHNIFQGYTFIFFDNKQFETLQPPISEGGGKGLHFPVEEGKTTAAEIAQHLKDAREAGLETSTRESIFKGAIQVRFAAARGYEDWTIQVQYQSMLITGQSLIEQNEFLDAILLKDASRLLRPRPPEETSEEASIPASAQSAPSRNQSRSDSTQHEVSEHNSTQRRSTQQRTTQQSHSEHQSSQAQASQASVDQGQNEEPAEPASRSSRRNRTRGTALRAFTGFVDDVPDASEPSSVAAPFEDASQAPPEANDAVQDDQMDVDAPSPGPAESRARGTKRRSPHDEPVNDEELFPAQAAVKRRRLEQEREARERGEPLLSDEEVKHRASLPKKKKMKRIDVQEAVRKRRQEQEEEKEDEEPMQEYLEKMTIHDMQRLAKVEEIKIPERKTPIERHDGAQSSDWNEAWNGRKNFKKFRRKGQGEVGPTRRAQTVIVPLEEVKNTDFGVQDDFWEQKNRAREERKKKAQGRAQERAEREETTPSQSFTDAHSHQEEVPAELVDGNEPEIIDVDAPRSTRRSERASQSHAPSVRSQAQSKKRPASRSGAASTIAKKQRKLDLVMEDDDDDESNDDDVPKFRFRKR